MQEFKQIHGSGNTTLIISNEEMNDIMNVVQALEDSDILLKGVTKTIKNETKEQKGGFLSMLLVHKDLHEHKDTGTHWIALFCMRNEVIYFDSFGFEHIPKEI